MRLRTFLVLTALTASAVSLILSLQPRAWPVAPPPPPAADFVLQPDVPVERTLRGGESQTFEITLEGGHFIEVVVEQKGIDVSVSLNDPAGQTLLTVDSPVESRGREVVFAVAADWGIHRLRVIPVDPFAPFGIFQIWVRRPWPASPEDVTRARASWLFSEGENLRRREAYPKAEEKYRQALPLWRKAGDHQGELNTLYRLGWVATDPGDALAALEQALTGFRALGNREREASTLNRIGTQLVKRNDFERARSVFSSALAIFRSLGDRHGEATALVQIANLDRWQGNFQAALAGAQRAMVLRRFGGSAQEQVEALTQLGHIYNSLGEPEQARGVFEEALRLHKTSPNVTGESSLLAGYARALENLERFPEAIAFYRDALRLQRDSGLLDHQAPTLMGLGNSQDGAGEPEEARRSYEEALRIYRELKDQNGIAGSLACLGRLASVSGEPARGLVLLEESLRLYRAVGNPRGEASSLFAMAEAEETLGNLTAALGSIEKSIDLVEAQRSGVSGALRASYFATRQRYYELAIRLLMRLHRERPGEGFDVLAFETGERTRARSLLDILIETPDDPRLAAGPAGREQALRREDNLPGAAAHRRPRPLGLAEVQKLLDPDTLLLAYSLGDRASYLWMVSDRSITSYELPGREEIEPLARETVRLLAQSGGATKRRRAERAVRDLGAMLLGPVAGELGSQRLVVVADGALQIVPFNALVVPGSPAVPLIVSHEISRLPSPSVLAALRLQAQRRTPATELIAVFADGVFSKDDPRLNGKQTRAASRDHGIPGFERLPYTRREAEAILALVPPDRAFSAMGFEATREAALDPKLASFQILHFATHGWLDERLPALSGLALTQFDREGRARDGFLRAHEISSLRLAADLVVLSACETALGKDVRGEGLMSLTRAFMNAGVPRVVVSLWKVNDEATAHLMVLFYKALKDGLPPAAALRQAQIAMSRDPVWSAPAHWAGFVLQGDWRMSPVPFQ